VGNREKGILMRRAAAFPVLVLAACAAAPLSAQTAETRDQGEARQEEPWFRPPNSIRLGDFRLDFQVRLHEDFRRFSPQPESDGWESTFRRARVGIEGRLYDDLEYEVDAELRNNEHPWRDIFLNYRRYATAEVRAGRFKVPFGREQLDSIFDVDFIERSLINSTLAPGRDTGAMVHGELAGILAYRTGVFAHDGDAARFDEAFVADHFEDVRAGDGAWAGRVIVSPWGRTRGPLRRLEAAAGMTLTTMDEGLFGVEGRTLSGYRFAERVYVRGRRTRYGVDGSWAPGPVSVQAEYIRLRDDRNGQGLGNVDLSDAVAQGWYVSAAWNVTGERSAQESSPRRPLFRGGIGAVELAARIESLRFGSAGPGGEPPFANPRAANILQNRDRILTLGVNWYPNRWGRVMINVTREHLGDPGRTPVTGRSTFWGTACRLQFAL
jgi:phosphate-selective porin OprO/OprP